MLTSEICAHPDVVMWQGLQLLLMRFTTIFYQYIVTASSLSIKPDKAWNISDNY